MKPSVFDRILLVLWCLAGMAAGVELIGMATGLFSAGTAYLSDWIQNPYVLGGAGAVFFLVSLRLIIGFNKRAGKEDGPAPATAALISNGDFGSTKITLAALDSMIQRHCRANPRVRETESVIHAVENGINVDLKLSLLNDTNVPETTAALQQSLKAYLEGLTGIRVNDVSILVVTAPPQKTVQK